MLPPRCPQLIMCVCVCVCGVGGGQRIVMPVITAFAPDLGAPLPPNPPPLPCPPAPPPPPPPPSRSTVKHRLHEGVPRPLLPLTLVPPCLWSGTFTRRLLASVSPCRRRTPHANRLKPAHMRTATRAPLAPPPRPLDMGAQAAACAPAVAAETRAGVPG